MMNSKLVLLVTMAAVLTLSGCLSQNTQPQQSMNQVPEIALEAPRDTPQFYYAVGEGDTSELAKNDALSQIASSISVSVSAEVSNKRRLEIEDDKQVKSKETTVTDVKSIAKTIEFTGVNIEETDTVNGLKHVLVSVDRNILFQSYLRKFETVDNKVKKEIAIFNKSPVFSQLKLSYDINGMLGKASELVVLLKAMNPGFDDKAITDRYDGYATNIRNIKQKAVFSITADKNSQSLATLIKNYLSEESIKMGNKSANVKLHISTQATDKKFKSSNSKVANLKMVNRVSTLKVKDSNGIVISNNVVKTRGSSAYSRDEAIQNTKQYDKLIKKNGILSFISGKK